MNQSDAIADLLKVVDDAAPSTANAPTLIEGDEIIEVDNFDFDDFQVVRREFFAHMREPSVTFNECKFQVNMGIPLGAQALIISLLMGLIIVSLQQGTPRHSELRTRTILRMQQFKNMQFTPKHS